MFNNNLKNQNIAGIPNRPINIGGINNTPNNIAGIRQIKPMENPFNKIKIDNQRSKQIMNSSGENIIRNNNMNNGGNYNGN